MLRLSHIQKIKTQLSKIESTDELDGHDKQLYELLQKHYTLFVGTDVSCDSFSINIKKANCETIYKDDFSNHHEGFCELISTFNLLNEQKEFKFQVAINEFISIRSFSRRSSRYSEQTAKTKTRLKDELVQASRGMLLVFPNQSVFNKAPMDCMKRKSPLNSPNNRMPLFGLRPSALIDMISEMCIGVGARFDPLPILVIMNSTVNI